MTALCLWWLCFPCSWADISIPKPHYEQSPPPPLDLPPYLVPWWMLWAAVPILFILICALRFRSQKKTVPNEE